MNTQRIIVLALALVAACGAAFLVRGMMGGGTPAVVASAVTPAVKMSEVLVAVDALTPGQKLTAEKVRWEKWPSDAVNATFITRDAVASAEDVTKDAVVRQPIQPGQPIASNAIVRGKASGFMAAMLSPGTRAVSIVVSAESGAGGFILPNDRVDLILTRKSNDNPPLVNTQTFMRGVRVLAMDQTFKEEKDQKTVLAKTATLELTPGQAETVARAQNMGQVSLSLRPLSEEDAIAADGRKDAPADVLAGNASGARSGPQVEIIRYGIPAPQPKASHEPRQQ